LCGHNYSSVPEKEDHELENRNIIIECSPMIDSTAQMKSHHHFLPEWYLPNQKSVSARIHITCKFGIKNDRSQSDRLELSDATPSKEPNNANQY